MSKATDKPQITVSLSKKQIIALATGAALLLIIFVFARFGYFAHFYNWPYQGELQVYVIDVETNSPVDDALITLTKSGVKTADSLKTDLDGKASIKLVAGDYNVNIVRAGYRDYQSATKVARRKISVNNFEMIKIPPTKVVVEGIAKDYIDEQPIAGANLTLEKIAVNANAQGQFSFGMVMTGDYIVRANAKGYLPLEKKITVTETTNSLDSINLVPEGTVVFVSNREQGKRAIYTANYDGSNTKTLIERIGEYEDYNPLLSPDKTKVLFQSTREGKRNNNGLVSQLYIVNIDGTNLRRISDNTQNVYNEAWSNDSSKIIYMGQNNQAVQGYVYDIIASKSTELLPNRSISSLLINDNATKVAYSYGEWQEGAYKHILFVANNDGTNAEQIIATTNSAYLNEFINNNEVSFTTYENNTSRTIVYNISTKSTKESAVARSSIALYKSSDAKKVAFTDARDGKTNVFIANADRSNEKRLTAVDTAYGNLLWLNSDRYILFSVSRTGEHALYIVGVSGGTAKKIVDHYGAYHQ